MKSAVLIILPTIWDFSFSEQWILRYILKECLDVQFGRWVTVLQMKMLPPHSEQEKTWKTDRALGITTTIMWDCDKITTFGKLNQLLPSVWLLGHSYIGTIITKSCMKGPVMNSSQPETKGKFAIQITKVAWGLNWSRKVKKQYPSCHTTHLENHWCGIDWAVSWNTGHNFNYRIPTGWN